MINREYFRYYRTELGFRSQSATKRFLGAKDVVPGIDFNYITELNKRLYEIVCRINKVVSEEIKVYDLDSFKEKYICSAFKTMRDSGIIPRLNNQGRRPEEVYFSWMRGYVVSNFFLKAIGIIFETDLSNISLIGDDSLNNISTFRRTPKADLEIELSKTEKVRIEVQSGFTGVNDIKQHKVLEAKRVYREHKVHTVGIHFDLFNGQVAFLKLDEIADNDVNWITRQQMEGQTVFNINQNYFVWKITEKPVKYEEIEFE